jgi:hypothetical protein
MEREFTNGLHPSRTYGNLSHDSNPILDEVWREKAQLAREANYDFDTFCAQLRHWEAEEAVEIFSHVGLRAPPFAKRTSMLGN